MASVQRSRADSWLDDWELVSRIEWGAEEPQQVPLPLVPPVPLIVFTQTNTRTCGTQETCIKVLQKLQKRHMATRPDIGYNYMIGGDWRVYEGTGWHSNGVLAAPPGHPGEDPLGGGEPPTVGEVLASAVTSVTEVTEPPPWDQAHGNFISIAFIGDYSHIFPHLKKAKFRNFKLPSEHPLQQVTPPDKQITKPYKLSQEVLRWLREHKHVRLDATVRWLKASKWRQFLQQVRKNCHQESVAKLDGEAEEKD